MSQHYVLLHFHLSVVFDAFKLYLSYSNSVFEKTNYLHTDGRVEGPHLISIALASCDSKAVASDISHQSRNVEKIFS